MKKLIILVAALLLLLSSCKKDEEFKSNSKEIYTSNYKYKIEIPLDWEKDEKDIIDDDIIISAFCPEREMYLMVKILEDASKTLPLSNYCNMTVKNLRKTYANMPIESLSFSDVTVSGQEFKYLELENIYDDNYTGHIWCYIGQYNDDYAAFIVSLPEEAATDEKREEIELIISTYKKA